MSSWLGIKDLQSRSNFLSTRISKSQVIIADKTRQVHLTRSVKNSQNNHTVSRVNKQCWSWGQKGPRFPSAHFPIAPPALVIPCWGQLHTPGMPSQINAHLKQSQHHSDAVVGRMGWLQLGGTTGDGLLQTPPRGGCNVTLPMLSASWKKDAASLKIEA